MSQSSSSIGPYHRLMREKAAQGSLIDKYLAPTTESEHEIHQHYLETQEYMREMFNGEGSSRTVQGMNPSEAQFIQDLDEGLILHKGVLEDHHKKILWTSDQVEALWFHVAKERRAKEKLQREMKITWFFMLLLSVVLAYVLYFKN
jgi:hypothetical protein